MMEKFAIPLAHVKSFKVSSNALGIINLIPLPSSLEIVLRLLVF